jgi:hypothetical protein
MTKVQKALRKLLKRIEGEKDNTLLRWVIFGDRTNPKRSLERYYKGLRHKDHR